MRNDRGYEVIFVEDDDALRGAMVQALQLENITVTAFASAAPASQRLSAEFAGVVVSDIRLPGMDGLAFFEHLQDVDPDLPLIFTTGHGDVGMAVGAMKKGAADFLTKPYSSSELIETIRRAAEKRLLIIENRRLRSALGNRENSAILGSSAQARRLRKMIHDVAAVDIDVMITGESGTGKNFVAEQIHLLSQRRDRPFVTIDAGTLLHKDAELIVFGRAPGSGLSRAGLVEKANGGTLFLDEVDTMPEAFQVRLLNLVERRMVQPIGSEREQPLNIRVISAMRNAGEPREASSTKDPGGMMFSPLYHRLSGISINLRPLVARREDIPELLRHFVVEYEHQFNLVAKPFGEREWHYLTIHDWPGNLRELRAFARNFVLGLLQFDQPDEDGFGEQSLVERVANFEKAVLADALRRHNGRAADVARALNIRRKTLYDKLTKHKLQPREFRED